MTELETLTRLADIDDELLKLSRQRDRILQRMPDATEVRDAAARARQEAWDAVQESKTAERDTDKRLHAFMHRKANANRALELGTSDAAAAIRQLEQCIQAIDELETELLELMEQTEALEEILSTAEASLAREEEHLLEVAASVDADLPPVEARQEELRAQKEVEKKDLIRDTRTRYELFSARKMAFARINGGACSRCHTHLGPQREQDVRRGRVLNCPRCHRWIVPG